MLEKHNMDLVHALAELRLLRCRFALAGGNLRSISIAVCVSSGAWQEGIDGARERFGARVTAGVTGQWMIASATSCAASCYQRFQQSVCYVGVKKHADFCCNLFRQVRQLLPSRDRQQQPACPSPDRQFSDARDVVDRID